jgi:hypothetical protein
MADLEATLIHGKVAKQGSALRFQQLLPELVGVEAPGPSRCINNKMASGVRRRRNKGRGALELLLVGRNELPVAGE